VTIVSPGVSALSATFAPTGCRHSMNQDPHDHSADSGHDHSHPWWGGERVRVAFAVTAAVCLVGGWLGGYLLPSDGFGLPDGLIAISYFAGGFFATIEALHGLRAGRFQIDFLMVLAAVGAAYIGHAEEGALLLVLFSLGHAAEDYAMGRAKRSIEALAELRPTTATLIDERSGETRDVPVEELKIGDTVIVRPDSRIAADGVVVQGESSVDQSTVTGESLPVDKLPVEDFDSIRDNWQSLAGEHKLFAGTINGAGAMRLRVTRTADDMTLARVMRLVTEAKTHRSPTQRLTDTLERRFVPAILVLVFSLPLAYLVIDEPFSASLYRAIAVLVGASPCALALATPSAVLSAVARGGRDGVLFKGGGPLELLGQVEVIAFDKTGTLTVGKPEVVDVILAPGGTRSELLDIAAEAETLSDHPLAGAVVRASEAEAKASSTRRPDSVVETGGEVDSASHSAPEDQTEVAQVERITGKGIRARLAAGTVWIGNARLFREPADDAEAEAPPPLPDWVLHADESLQAQGRSTMIVCWRGEFLGVIGVADVARPTAAEMIRTLRQIGVGRFVMLSGDNQRAAQAIADELGIDEVFGDLSPEDKLDAIGRIAEQTAVAMIGDGVNDAPALAAATVSIAMGAAGSDVALETADVALMADDLSRLPFAVSLSRQASRVIRQNLWISLGMIAVLVPAALFGLQLAVAVVFHEGSTLVVVLNALRLLVFRAPVVADSRGPSEDAVA